MSAVPVTLVTGFLGAGKTTLVNHLLQSSGERLAIVENEFGALNVDGALLGAAAGMVFELSEGCVCCTVREDLIAVFVSLAAHPDLPGHVVIEASGLADPAPVMRVFEDPQVRQRFSLNGVVTVVDAVHLEPSLHESPTCAEQIACADLLVLNKVDCLPEAAAEATLARLRRLNPLASVVQASHAAVDPQVVLGLGRVRLGPGLGGHSHDHHHHHDETIGSVSVEVAGDVDVVALDRWLERLLLRQGLLRMKGVLAVRGHARRFVFHGVRSVVEVQPGAPWGDSPRVSRAVFIGRGLRPDEIRAGFARCLLA